MFGQQCRLKAQWKKTYRALAAQDVFICKIKFIAQEKYRIWPGLFLKNVRFRIKREPEYRWHKMMKIPEFELQ